MIEVKRENFVVSQKDIQLKNIFLQKNIMNNSFSFFGFNEKPDFDSATVICVATKVLGEEDVEYFSGLSRLGKRIYILLGDQNNKSNKAAIKRLAGHCLIRTGVSQSGSIVITDPNTAEETGWIYATNKIASEDRSVVKSNQKSVEWLFQTFCYLFWKMATHEFFTQDKEPKEIRTETNPVMEILTDQPYCKPNMFYESLSEDFSDLISLDIITSIKNSQWINEILPEDRICQNIGFILSNENSDEEHDITEFCDKASNGFIIESSNSKIHNSIIKNNNSIYLIPNNPVKEEVNWSYVTDDTKYGMMNYPHNWELKKSEVIGNLQENSKIRFSERPGIIYDINAQEEVNLGSIESDTIEEFCKESRIICEEKGLIQFNRNKPAHKIIYSIEIHPPYLPNNVHSEYLGWDTFQNQWESKLQNLDIKIKKHNDEKLSWKKSVMSRIQGKEQKLFECQDKISKLRDFTFADKSPGLRIQKESEYQELCKNIDILISDSLAEKKLFETEENWKNKEQDIRINLGKKNEQLKNEKDEKKKSSIKNDIERLTEDLERHHKIKPIKAVENTSDDLGKILKVKDKDQKNTSFQYPKEELPTSGLLFANEKGRYLAINSLDNLEKAKIEAQRLNAKICVKEE